MNENSEIQKLLHKYILNQCTLEETNDVVDYFKKNKNSEDFPTVEDVKLLLEEIPTMDTNTADKIFSKIITDAKEIETTIIQKEKMPIQRYLSIAASIIVLLSIGWWYNQQDVVKTKSDLLINSNEITLQLANGEIQVITEGKKTKVTDSKGNLIGNQNGNKIVYDTKTALKELVFNTIKIPYGKRFELELSDGTLVHLNSGSSLKYPVTFITGKSRKVFLDGEAFFDVSKDKSHPFVVNADNLNIRVLGTHFNVSNYGEDDLTEVVLVEGSVGLYNTNENFDTNKSTLLKPGYKGSFNKKDDHISTTPVITDSYTSWMQGGLTFRNMSFKNISKKLERHYNVTIKTQNEKLNNEIFNASFKNNESIEKVLSYFDEVYGIKYTLKNNQIVIK